MSALFFAYWKGHKQLMELRKIGLVAGRERYPLLFAEEARKHGVEKLVVIAFHGETEAAMEKLADHLEWVYVGQLNKTIKAFCKHDVRHVVFAGQITPGRLFRDFRPDLRTVKALASLREKNATTLFSALAAEFEKDGIEVLPATTFLEQHLAAEGILGKVTPGKTQRQDIELGSRIACETSRLNIGQTVVIKNGTILAVEAFEGTDEAILRGGELGHGGVTVVKVAKPGKDIRFDIPCIGRQTVGTLKQAGAKALAVQSGITLIIDKDEVINAFNRAKIALVGIKLGDEASTA